MKIHKDDLLPNENLILSKNANAVVKLSEYGSKMLPGDTDKMMSRIGFSGKEAIGGKLHLTNFRLIFKSHAINRLTGKFSVFYNTIENVTDTSKFLVKKIEVKTRSQIFEFVIWGIPKVISEIKSNKQRLTAIELQKLQNSVRMDYSKVGSGLDYCVGVDLLVNPIPKIEEILSDPIATSSLANLIEFLGDE